MGRTLYYVPSGSDHETLKEQIGYAFEGAKGDAIRQDVLSGPCSQGPGIILGDRSWRDDIDRVRLDVDAQYWRRIPGSIAYVGRYRDEKLSPSAMQRETLVEGAGVVMGDGSVWQCAYARKFNDLLDSPYFSNPLPTALELNENGQWVPTRVATRFARLSELASMYWDAMAAAIQQNTSDVPIVRFEFPQIDEFAILGLQANYRVGAAELALWPDVYDLESRDRLIAAIFDKATQTAWVKKKIASGESGSDSLHGAEVSTPAN